MNVRKLVVGVVLAVSVLVPVVADACSTSWVLWVNDGHVWQTKEGYATRELCVSAKTLHIEVYGKFTYGTQCLPDTIDPRPRSR